MQRTCNNAFENPFFSRVSTIKALISITKEIVALVLAIAPKEQSDGMCAARSAGLQPVALYGVAKAYPGSITFVWNPRFQPLESGVIFMENIFLVPPCNKIRTSKIDTLTTIYELCIMRLWREETA